MEQCDFCNNEQGKFLLLEGETLYIERNKTMLSGGAENMFVKGREMWVGIYYV